jgi:hypothetical protein
MYLSCSLGHQKLNRTFFELIERVSNRLSLRIRNIAEDRNQEVRFGRLLRHGELCLNEMIQMGVEFSMSGTSTEHVLLVQDSSELSFGFNPFQSGLSEVGSGTELGFYIHPVIALDAKSHICLGLANVEVFKREERQKDRNREKFEHKQSFRWLSSVLAAQQHCAPCKDVTVVSDREGDIYDALCGYKSEGMGFVIRSCHNRPLGEENKGLKLNELTETWEVQGSYECDLPRTDKRSAHKALLEVKYGKVALSRPEKAVSKHLDRTLEVFVVEVKEHSSSIVNNEQPIQWRLITSHPVCDMASAQEIILWYTKRWNIEQVFRLLKKQGLDLTESLAHKYETLSRLAVVGLVAAVRVLQLVTARDNPDNIPASIAFSDHELEILEALNPKLEGRTEIQKNPHPPKTLAFSVWVIARLGGWKSYSKSERPPGPITFLNGLKRLQNFLDLSILIHSPNNSP